MTWKKTAIAVILSLVCVTAIITASFLIPGLLLQLAFSSGNSTHSSDQAMEKTFQLHESDLNKLVGMSNEDSKIIRIANDFTRLENNWAWPRPESEIGFSRQWWDEYRPLFKKIGTKYGIDRGKDGSVSIVMSATGMVAGGDTKGYAYMTKEPFPTTESLNNISIKAKSNVPVYKKVKGNWYIYYMRDD